MAKSKGPSADELRQQVTDRLISALEAGTRPWIKPWIGDPNAGFPTNIASENRYRGVNPWLLDMTASAAGYSSKWWGTYAQWGAKKGQVRKGEEGTVIVFWKIIDRWVTNEETGEKEKEKTFFLRYSKVFNLDQVDNVVAPSKVRSGKEWIEGHPADKPHPLDALRVKVDDGVKFEHTEYEPAELVIEQTGANITYGKGRACYYPSTDGIDMPSKDKFPKLEDFYSTIFHELTHWAEKRTGFVNEKDKSYALGELVAEIGACYVCEHVGVPINSDTEFVQQHAAYLKSWLGALKDDPKFIFKASKWASKAADLLLGDEVVYEDEPSNDEEPALQEAA